MLRMGLFTGSDLTKNAKGKVMASRKVFLLPGDGIGPEATAEVTKIINWMNEALASGFEVEEGLVGGAAYDAHGEAISDSDMEKALAADAVLFGAVGGPKWDDVPYEARPEAGLLRLRKDMELFANLRPAICYPALADSSSLRKEVVEGLDILIVRELTGGVYFGEPKTITDLGNGQKRAVDTQVYDTFEIERIAGVAFEMARTRDNRVCSMEKRNVMKSGVLWNEVVSATHKEKYADVELDHMLADAGGMQLVRPVHGSAPDIAGQGIANPIAMIASFAMMLRYSFNMVEEADKVEKAIANVLDTGKRTGDIWSEGNEKITTAEMGDAILAELQNLTA